MIASKLAGEKIYLTISTGIPGEKGDQGESGAQGEQGVKGDPGEIAQEFIDLGLSVNEKAHQVSLDKQSVSSDKAEVAENTSQVSANTLIVQEAKDEILPNVQIVIDAKDIAVLKADEANESALNASIFGTGSQTAIPTDTPNVNVKLYNISTEGTYTNFGGLIVSSDDLLSNFVQLRKVDGVWLKYLLPTPSQFALETDFTQVQSAVNSSDLIYSEVTGIDRTDNLALASGGVITPSANWNCLEIAIVTGKQYFVDGSNINTNASLVVYYNGITFISAQFLGVASVVTTYFKQLLTIPTNATKFIVNTYKPSGVTARAYVQVPRPNFYTRLESYGKTELYSRAEIDSLVTQDAYFDNTTIAHPGAFVPTSGVFTISANWNCVEMSIVTGVSYYATGSNRNSNASLAVYFTAGGVFISYEYPGILNVTTSYDKQLLHPPINAAKVFINTYIPSGIDPKIFTIVKVPVFYSKSDTYNKTETDKKIYTDEDEYVSSGVFHDNSFVLASGVVTSSVNWSSYEAAYEIGKSYYATGSTLNTISALAVYFNGNVFISAQFIGIASVTTPYYLQLLTIPVGTTKIFVNTYKASGVSPLISVKQKKSIYYPRTQTLSTAEIQALVGSAGGYNGADGNVSLKQINFIPSFGQSLNQGEEATPPISTVQKYKSLMFNTGVIKTSGAVGDFTSFIPLVESTNETSASGTSETIIEAIKMENGVFPQSPFFDNYKFLFGAHGAGGQTIYALRNTYLTGFLNAVQGAKNICTSTGKTLNVPAWIWMQGESDLRGIDGGSQPTKSAYKAALLELHTYINTQVKAITGQTNNLKCICYQTGNIALYSQDFGFSNAYCGVPMAQLELINEQTDFVSSSPVYIYDFVKGNNIHLTNISEKLHGAYQGYAIKKAIIDQVAHKPVYPKTITITGNKIDIKFNVPSLPLKFDTSWVREAANYGFDVVKSTNAHIITSVSVLGDTVTIQCSESPLNCKLRYGVNGETVSYSGLGYVTGMSGRIDGARGNLRDSQGDFVRKEIQGVTYPLHNYSYCFDILLSSASIIV